MMYIPKVHVSTSPLYDKRTGAYVDTEINYDLTVESLINTINLLSDSVLSLSTDISIIKAKITGLETVATQLAKENEQLKSREINVSKKLARAAKCHKQKE